MTQIKDVQVLEVYHLWLDWGDTRTFRHSLVWSKLSIVQLTSFKFDKGPKGQKTALTHHGY